MQQRTGAPSAPDQILRSDQVIDAQSNVSAIALLKDEHRIIKQMLDLLADGSDEQQQVMTLNQLKMVLTLHNATEEDFVYPAIREIAGLPDDSAELYHEQDEAKVLVWKIDTCFKEGRAGEALLLAKQLRDAVYDHIATEESSDFPALEQQATPQQAQMMNDAVAEFRSKVGKNRVAY